MYCKRIFDVKLKATGIIEIKEIMEESTEKEMVLRMTKKLKIHWVYYTIEKCFISSLYNTYYTVVIIPKRTTKRLY